MRIPNYSKKTADFVPPPPGVPSIARYVPFILMLETAGTTRVPLWSTQGGPGALWRTQASQMMPTLPSPLFLSPVMGPS